MRKSYQNNSLILLLEWQLKHLSLRDLSLRKIMMEAQQRNLKNRKKNKDKLLLLRILIRELQLLLKKGKKMKKMMMKKKKNQQSLNYLKQKWIG